jgi:hypothetical protein
MTSAAQIAANRRNSTLSTGPRSAAGKAQSRRNALRHGLAARTLVTLPGEDEAEFAAFAADMMQDLAPDGAVEEALARRIATLAWRLERVARIEAQLVTGEGRLLAAESGNPDAALAAFPEEMSALARYEGTLDRAFERAMKLLRERQRMRLMGELPACEEESAERSQFAEAESAERSQFDADDEDLPAPLDVIAGREAERMERARLIAEAGRPKSVPATV